MPLIRVEMFKGRTDEQKKVLVKELLIALLNLVAEIVTQST